VRKIKTKKGEVHYERTLLRCPKCGHYFALVDAELGVSPRQCLTPSLRDTVAWLGARSSYLQATEELMQLLDVSISDSEFQRATLEVGKSFEAVSQEQDAQWSRPASPTAPAREPEISPDRLVVMADGVCVLTVKGEDHKTVYCGRAFALESRGRKDAAPEAEDARGRPFIGESRFAASGINFEDFMTRMRALLYRCGWRQARQTAFIADGARCLWLWAAEALGSGAVLIQDFWHVCERLSNVAQEVWGEGWETKWEEWKTLLRESHATQVLQELRIKAAASRGEKRRLLCEMIGYMEGANDRMDYARYAREGWPIGSGAIEGTCKHLVKERFNVTGARWRRGNIPAVLALRAAQANKDWERYRNLSQVA
jgi:hypothetical protein